MASSRFWALAAWSAKNERRKIARVLAHGSRASIVPQLVLAGVFSEVETRACGIWQRCDQHKNSRQKSRKATSLLLLAHSSRLKLLG